MRSTTAMTRGIQVPPSGRYRLDLLRSSITFRTKLFGGMQTVSGNMRAGGGEITVDHGPKASVAVTINAESFWTGNYRRDEDVRSPRVFHAEKYREFIFRADSLTRKQERWTLNGELTVREVTRPVSLTIESVELTDEGFRARARSQIDRLDFGFTRVRWIGGRLYDTNVIAVAARP